MPTDNIKRFRVIEVGGVEPNDVMEPVAFYDERGVPFPKMLAPARLLAPTMLNNWFDFGPGATIPPFRILVFPNHVVLDGFIAGPKTTLATTPLAEIEDADLFERVSTKGPEGWPGAMAMGSYAPPSFQPLKGGGSAHIALRTSGSKVQLFLTAEPVLFGFTYTDPQPSDSLILFVRGTSIVV